MNPGSETISALFWIISALRGMRETLQPMKSGTRRRRKSNALQKQFRTSEATGRWEAQYGSEQTRVWFLKRVSPLEEFTDITGIVIESDYAAKASHRRNGSGRR
jgi:hypothetical protein